MMEQTPPPLPPEGSDRAAIMVMLLPEDDASRLLAHLTPDELRQLAATMCRLGEVEPHAVADAIAGFSRSTGRAGIPAHQRLVNVRRLIEGAVGEMKAENVLRRAVPDELAQPTLGLLSWLDPAVIADLLRDEHPQAIAVLLLQLETEIAAAALAALPEALHTTVLHRVARMGPVSRDGLAMLEETLAAKIERLHGAIPLTMGGIRRAAQIINTAHRTMEQRIMPALGEIDADCAQDIERELFKFEDLLMLDDKMTGILLREVDSSTLVLALRGLGEAEREHFFGAMSARAADGLREEIEEQGRTRRTDIEAAQRGIVAIARRLIAAGDLILSNGDGDYV